MLAGSVSSWWTSCTATGSSRSASGEDVPEPGDLGARVIRAHTVDTRVIVFGIGGG
jgi:hypothetical protein